MKKNGYSLIEMLVAMSIFVIVSGLLAGLFFTSLQIQRRTFVSRDLQDNARFIFDLLSKEIRTGINFSQSSSTNLTFTNDRGQPVTYNLAGNAIQRNSATLTSSGITVNLLNFTLTGQGFNDGQPKVSIVLKMSSVSGLNLPPLEVQTTISPRQLDANH